jgi:hypothetical protein
MENFLKKHYGKIIIIAAVLITVGFFLSRIFLEKERGISQVFENQSEQTVGKTSAEKINFTAKIFDPALISHIIPLGELNGGYEEAQTINGVTINIKTDAKRNASEIDVYAPTDMTLEDYSYFTGGQYTPNWHLGFRISKDLKLSFDHITWVPDEIRKATPPTPTSGYVPPTKKLSFKAGDLVAKTSGTDQAHNWNIYLRDNSRTNIFANQARFERMKNRYDYLNAVCPFDYYDDAVKRQFIALMGWTKAGQSKTCGTNSRDVKGSISGMWHLAKDGVQAEYQGAYATPFSIYKTASDEIIVYEIDRKRFILDKTNPSYKDPAAVTGSHCYALTEYGNTPANGYAYFKILSDMEMKMAYSPTGACPEEFPEKNGTTYYR